MADVVTAQEALAAWDRGEIVQTVEMGGIGPSYEQALQILVFEIIRAAGDREKALKACAEGVGGFSGAQAGAAAGFARLVMEKGWSEVVASVEEDRRILVSRYYPRAPEASP
jgi:hypothetical protein